MAMSEDELIRCEAIEKYIREHGHQLHNMQSGLTLFMDEDSEYWPVSIAPTSEEFREWARARYVRAILECHRRIEA